MRPQKRSLGRKRPWHSSKQCGREEEDNRHVEGVVAEVTKIQGEVASSREGEEEEEEEEVEQHKEALVVEAEGQLAEVVCRFCAL